MLRRRLAAVVAAAVGNSARPSRRLADTVKKNMSHERALGGGETYWCKLFFFF